MELMTLHREPSELTALDSIVKEQSQYQRHNEGHPGKAPTMVLRSGPGLSIVPLLLRASGCGGFPYVNTHAIAVIG